MDFVHTLTPLGQMDSIDQNTGMLNGLKWSRLAFCMSTWCQQILMHDWQPLSTIAPQKDQQQAGMLAPSLVDSKCATLQPQHGCDCIACSQAAQRAYIRQGKARTEAANLARCLEGSSSSMLQGISFQTRVARASARTRPCRSGSRRAACCSLDKDVSATS